MSNGSGESNGNDKDTAVAKTAGFVVFSGIALSILKALNPYNNNHKKSSPESIPPFQESKSPPLQEPATKVITEEKTIEPMKILEIKESSPRAVEIVKGDTLWGLSRKYGVSIDAIKEANGLAGDTIYAGKKLVIP
ncbi:hypothetical protein HHK36_001707 [Tetracentron sinense]|uniref:LysM domain-containing protein n=1 Tax=Tetracentron sinense TaxID=13715 RepID=A0A834ZXS2_TETSI|nr:hypothetical protein HHK36_001707 [Tetracentron sinense]